MRLKLGRKPKVVAKFEDRMGRKFEVVELDPPAFLILDETLAEVAGPALRSSTLDECQAIAQVQIGAAGNPTWAACARHIRDAIAALRG
jgi:hypothetical protein